MDIYLKISASVLVASVLSVVISGNGKDISLLLTLFVCAVTMVAALNYLRPVIDFAHKLIETGKLSNEYLQVLLKIVGIGMISQVSTLICTDAGNQTLGKVLNIVTTIVILCISIPLLEEILALILSILGEI